MIGRHVVLRNVDLSISSGSLTALLGPSGSGKTTLLRVIAGLEELDCGSVHIGGGDATRVPVQQRGVGFVFQHYALFRTMTVFENIAFGLRVRSRSARLSGDRINGRVNELLELVQLVPFAQRYPAQLSGGQRQRVALARALATEPKVLLLDEPFGALDIEIRRDLRRWLRRLHDDLGVTTVLVTHDRDEACEVADQVAVMSEGCIARVGPPDRVLTRSAESI